MVKKKDKSWQYMFSTTLAGITLLLVLGYFVQSFLEIRKVKPMSVAIERIKNTATNIPVKPEEVQTIKDVK